MTPTSSISCRLCRPSTEHALGTDRRKRGRRQ
jgi:hypothetical protein